jgi:hypothetical protein
MGGLECRVASRGNAVVTADGAAADMIEPPLGEFESILGCDFILP